MSRKNISINDELRERLRKYVLNEKLKGEKIDDSEVISKSLLLYLDIKEKKRVDDPDLAKLIKNLPPGLFD